MKRLFWGVVVGLLFGLPLVVARSFASVACAAVEGRWHETWPMGVCVAVPAEPARVLIVMPPLGATQDEEPEITPPAETKKGVEL